MPPRLLGSILAQRAENSSLRVAERQYPLYVLLADFHGSPREPDDLVVRRRRSPESTARCRGRAGARRRASAGTRAEGPAAESAENAPTRFGAPAPGPRTTPPPPCRKRHEPTPERYGFSLAPCRARCPAASRCASADAASCASCTARTTRPTSARATRSA